MTFFKLIFSSAVLFLILNVHVAHPKPDVPNHVPGNFQLKGSLNYQNYKYNTLLPKGARYRSIVINEIMADPNPPNKLPDAEFIEILNTTGASIDLTGWTISDSKSSAILPTLKIGPNHLIILCDMDDESLFNELGTVVGLKNWPTLNNGGDNLVLRSEDSTTIDQVSYTTNWYQDPDKSRGGWSLEQINPFDACPDEMNWRASQEPAGGTPGKQNSVLEIAPDLRGPGILSVVVQSPQRLTTFFDEKIDALSLSKINIKITPENELDNIDYTALFTSKVDLLFKKPLQSNTQYTITVKNVTDCAGNLIDKEKNSFQFALTVAADSMDLVINEVLFNPRTGGKDFIEIFNASQKFINMKSMLVSNDQSTAEKPKIAKINNDLIIKPGQYVVLTEDVTILKADYPFGNEETFYELKGMPTFADDQGNVTLADSTDKVIDSFDYSESYHHELIRDRNGVSLERVSASGPTNMQDNWHSAASAVGYATPGYENSQNRVLIAVDDQIFVDPKVFVPNNNGVNDFTRINYQFNKMGYLLSIFVFDVKGRLIKEIANNDLASMKGFYQWDGTTNQSGLLANPGFYILLVDVLDPEGHSFQLKKTVVVATDF